MNTFHCRSCGSSHGRSVLDLGLQPLANNLLSEADLAKPEPRFPLQVALCEGCWLLQITDIVPPVELFSEYLYFSSFSDALLRHAAEAAAAHLRDGDLGGESFVVEIASNDGYLLKNFVAAGVPCLGIEPESLDERLRHRGKMRAHIVRCCRQFLHREIGHDENEVASAETLHEPDGMLRELVVLAASDHGGVYVDPGLHTSSYTVSARWRYVVSPAFSRRPRITRNRSARRPSSRRATRGSRDP